MRALAQQSLAVVSVVLFDKNSKTYIDTHKSSCNGSPSGKPTWRSSWCRPKNYKAAAECKTGSTPSLCLRKLSWILEECL